MLDELAIAIAVTKIKQKVICMFLRIAKAMIRPFTCRAITWPFARLAIASLQPITLITKIYSKVTRSKDESVKHDEQAVKCYATAV